MSTDDFTAQWEEWHRAHEERRARPYGFLAITGLHWLSEEPARFDDAPGVWSSDANGVRVDLDEGATLVVEGVAVLGRYDFGVVDESGVGALYGSTLIEVCRRDGQFMIRPRDPDLQSQRLHRHADVPGERRLGRPRHVRRIRRTTARERRSQRGRPHPRVHVPRRGRVRTLGYDAATGRLRRRGLRWTIVHLHGPDLRSHHLSGLSVPHRGRTARGRQCHHRLQPRDQSGVRLHRLRYLPVAPRGQSPPGPRRAGEKLPLGHEPKGRPLGSFLWSLP